MDEDYNDDMLGVIGCTIGWKFLWRHAGAFGSRFG
jgi:hypothetical protein